MALIKHDNFMGFEFDAYLKITAMIIWKNGDIAIDVASYKDKDQKTHYKLEQFYFNFSELEPMDFAKAYSCLKTIPEFANVKDTFEEGQTVSVLKTIPKRTYGMSVPPPEDIVF